MHVVDISAAMLAEVRCEATNVFKHLGNGREIPSSVPGKLDGAYSVTMFQHVPQEAQLGYLCQVAYLLRPRARFAFTLAIGSGSEKPDFLNHKVTWEMAFDWVKQAGMLTEEEFVDDRGWVWFSAVKS